MVFDFLDQFGDPLGEMVDLNHGGDQHHGDEQKTENGECYIHNPKIHYRSMENKQSYLLTLPCRKKNLIPMPDLFDTLKINPQDIIRFPEGIPGFDSVKEFVLVSVAEHAPFEWLVCASNKDLRFAVVDPLLIMPDYDPPVKKDQIAPLKLESGQVPTIRVILTLKENLLNSTANFMGPVFINPVKMIACQLIIDTDRYSVQEPVIRQ